MPANLRVYNSKEIKEVRQLLEQQFGFSGKLDYVFLLGEKKQRLYLATPDLGMIDYQSLPVDAMGLYAAAYVDDGSGSLRITIDGAQLIGPHCAHHVIELSREERTRWMMGQKLLLAELDIPPAAQKQFAPDGVAPEDVKGIVLLRFENHWLGSGKIAGETILNYVPKTRFVHASYD